MIGALFLLFMQFMVIAVPVVLVCAILKVLRQRWRSLRDDPLVKLMREDQ